MCAVGRCLRPVYRTAEYSRVGHTYPAVGASALAVIDTHLIQTTICVGETLVVLQPALLDGVNAVLVETSADHVSACITRAFAGVAGGMVATLIERAFVGLDALIAQIARAPFAAAVVFLECGLVRDVWCGVVCGVQYGVGGAGATVRCGLVGQYPGGEHYYCHGARLRY